MLGYLFSVHFISEQTRDEAILLTISDALAAEKRKE